MTGLRGFLIAVIAVALLTGLDQWSKHWVDINLAYQAPFDVLPFVSLFRTYNDGVAFSMLSGFGTGGLITMSIIVLLIVVWIWLKTAHCRLIMHTGFILIAAGAIGNIIDRVRFGYVVDFIQFHTDHWSFAIFNLADAFITMGVVAIILDEILAWNRARNLNNRTQ